MARYFLEVAYKGTAYAGFQTQQNAVTVQSEVEQAMAIILRPSKLVSIENNEFTIKLTGSSRTDAGVHAAQNFFHFDWPLPIPAQIVYQLNAILPSDIAVRSVKQVSPTAHARFDAVQRRYQYHIHTRKNPFAHNLSSYYPYAIDINLLHQTAAIIKEQKNFFPFAKTNTQVKNFNCHIYESRWEAGTEKLVYEICGNRFLRGMVRLLVGTQLKVGRGQLSLENFQALFGSSQKAGYSAPAAGLHLVEVQYK